VRIYRLIILLILLIIIINSCSSIGVKSNSSANIDGYGISARGGIGRVETFISGPMYTGDGGSNIRLAILAPEIQGDVPSYLPLYIQGLLNNNFNKFSAVNLIDRQNLDRIISEQNMAAGGRFSNNDFIRIGNLTNAQYFLFGTIQKLPVNRYSLQLSITEASTGVIKAAFMKEGTLTQLEGRGLLLNEAAVELLEQLGVQLTEAGIQSLIAGNASAVQAATGLARGITAQAGGSEIEALFNFAQAITFDPSQLEALTRLNTLSSAISGGTISQRILNDIQARDQWLEAFKEAARFFNDHPPFEIVFDPNLIQIGETNFSRRTATLGMRIALDSSEAGFAALNALLEGLEKTGRRSAWGFSGWPLMDISPRTSGTVVFNGRRSLSFRVEVSLVNENGKTISTNFITLNSESLIFSSGDKNIKTPLSIEDVIRFNNVKVDDLTPTLTIVIASVNGIRSADLNASGYMRIETGDLEAREREKERLRPLYQAIENYTQAIRINPNNANTYYSRGNRYVDLGNYNQAIEDYTQAIRINPNDANAYWGRGYSYAELGNNNQAIEDYTQAITINPNNAILYNNRGNCYNNLGNYNQAIEDYTQVIRIDPNNANAYFNRGLAYDLLGNFNQAIEDYTQAIMIDPNNAWAYYHRGYCYDRLFDYNQAISDYTQAIRINPNDALAYHFRGFCYYFLGNYNQAIEDYTQAIRINPNNAGAYNNRGYSYARLGNHNQAIADYSQAIKINPNDATVYFTRGLAYDVLGNHNQAISDYSQVIKIDPNNILAYHSRGNCYDILGDYIQAISDYSQIIRIDPNSDSAYNLRGVAYENLNDFVRARSDYEAALRLDPNNTTYRNNLNEIRNR